MKKSITSLLLLFISIFIFSSATAQKKLTATYGETYDGSSYTPFDSVLYNYNAQGKVLKELRKIYDAGTWKNSSAKDYTYNTNNMVESYVYSTWKTSAWEPGYKYVYTYDGSNNVTQIETRQMKGGNWKTVNREYYFLTGTKIDSAHNKKVDSLGNESNYQRTIYSYTGTGKLAQTLTYDYETTSSQWEESVKWVYAYNTLDQLARLEEENILGTGWYKVHYYDYTYDNENLLRGAMHKVSSNGTIIGRTTYKYEGDPNTSVFEIARNNFAVSAYPNPVKSYLKISWENSGNFSFALTDIGGKQVAAMDNITTSSVELNNLALQQGLYFYTLQSADGSYFYTGKVIAE